MAGQQHSQGYTFNISAKNREIVNHPIIIGNRVGSDIQCPMNITEPLGDQQITHAPQVIDNQVKGTINTDVTYSEGARPQ
ncbi:hypothetical protein AALO_G00252810 [Alosa alosa]|uniref:Uncharacterized protein n=1 Tax=Alosa alosa TaxID=278164 RepID=A0AAV6FS58_9TELE|nr:hypothetical protein AALO_G00252810 [Alosa alosa]